MSKNYNTEFLPEEIIQTMQKSTYHNYLYFTSYDDINKNYLLIRNSLFSLIHKVSNKMNFKSNTYFLSIYYLDIIFLKNKIPSLYNDNYELLCLTCLVLAAKHLENDPIVPHLQYFVNTYNYIIKDDNHDLDSKTCYNYAKISFKDLMLSEVIVCKMLNYKLNYFTIYDFNSFFFGHGILKIELLNDIAEGFSKGNNENYMNKNEDDDDELNYINPTMIKKILEKIYKKSRAYLNNIIKNKICLKYDSFLISIYIMHKSVEYVILKENKIIYDAKKEEKYYIEKKQENLRKKIYRYFKEIMNDIYKIDLENLEEYQYLINDEDFLKFFYPSKNNNKATPDNNKNEIDINERLDKIHRKYQSNNIDVFQKITKLEKSQTIERKEFSPKKIPHIKIPSEKYNKIKRLKILERLNKYTKTSKNSFTKTFVLSNSNEKSSKKQINTYMNTENKEILSKSNYNLNLNDPHYFDITSKNDIKNKTININKHNDKYVDNFKLRNKIKQYQNNTYLISDINLKHSTILDNNYFQKLGLEKDININKNNLDNSAFNLTNFNQENNSNKKIHNLEQNTNKTNQNDNSSITIKPYSKKVIPKIENKNKKAINRNRHHNKNNKYESNYISINSSINNANENKNNNSICSNNLDLRNSNADKSNNKLLENNISNSIDVQKIYSSNIKNKSTILNKFKITKDSENNASNKYKRNVPLLKRDNKKCSMSVNKIKVNGVSTKNKVNKKIFFGMHKTPMKTENNLKNALKRNIGVKRGNNNNNSVLSKNNSQDNSIDEPYKDKEKNIDKNNNNNSNKDYSCINFSLSSRKSSKLNGNENITKIIKIKNEISNDNSNNFNNSDNELIKADKNKNQEISSSSEEEEFNEQFYNFNNIRANNNENNNYKNLNGKIKKYKIKKILDNMDKNKIGKNIPKIELIQINKKKSPKIVINNNINVNFDNNNIGLTLPLSKINN